MRLQVSRTDAASESMWLSLSCRLLEQRLLRKLRFESGDVYTCNVSPFFGCEAPSWQGPIRGDVAIAFSCDPSSSSRLSQKVMAELELLQKEGPEPDEVTTVLTVEARSRENEVQENQYWLEVRVIIVYYNVSRSDRSISKKHVRNTKDPTVADQHNGRITTLNDTLRLRFQTAVPLQ